MVGLGPARTADPGSLQRSRAAGEGPDRGGAAGRLLDPRRATLPPPGRYTYFGDRSLPDEPPSPPPPVRDAPRRRLRPAEAEGRPRADGERVRPPRARAPASTGAEGGQPAHRPH